MLSLKVVLALALGIIYIQQNYMYTCIWVCKLYTENKASIHYSGWSKATYLAYA